MKNVYLCNFPTKRKGFGAELLAALSKKGVVSVLLDAPDCLMDLGNGTSIPAQLIHKKEKVSVLESLFFMKKREPYATYSSLFLTFVAHLGAECMNAAFQQHHANVSKQFQYINLAAHGFRIPHTILVSPDTLKKYKKYIESVLTYPFVVKASGSGGEYVWKVHTFAEIVARLATVSKKRKEVIVLQEFIQESHEEYRAVLCYGEIVSYVIRSSKNFHNNYAQGGKVSTGTVSSAELALCKKAARISGLDYLGVDFMKTKSGEQIFIELQTGPSLSVSKKANSTVVEDIANVLLKKVS